MLPSRVIRRQLPSLEWSPDFRMKVMVPLLMKSEVSPQASIARNARRRVGAISSTFSWKKEKFSQQTNVAWGFPLGQRGDGICHLCHCEFLGHLGVHVLCDPGRHAFPAPFLSFCSVWWGLFNYVKFCVELGDVVGEVLLSGDCPPIYVQLLHGRCRGNTTWHNMKIGSTWSPRKHNAGHCCGRNLTECNVAFNHNDKNLPGFQGPDENYMLYSLSFTSKANKWNHCLFENCVYPKVGFYNHL